MKSVNVMQRINTGLLLLIVSYGLFWLFLGAYYSHPNAEDFSLTATPKNEGIINAAAHLLVSYDGRFFTNILHGINPMALGWLGGYKWTIAFGIVFFVFSIWYFIQSINGGKKKIQTLLLSALFTVIHFALTPSLVHELYWMVSSFVYLYCWCFTLLWVGSFIRFITTIKNSSKKFYFTLTSFFLVCSMGINEMMLVINSFLFVSFGFYQFTYIKREKFAFCVLSLLIVVSYVFFLSSPGISKRFGSFAEEHQGSHYNDLLRLSFFDFSKVFFEFIIQGGFLIFLILAAILGFRKVIVFNRSLPMPSLKIKFLFVLLGFLSLYFMTYAFYIPMGYGEYLPNRIYTSVSTGFLLFFLPGVFLFIGRYSWILNFSIKMKTVFLMICYSGILYSLNYADNSILHLKEDFISGKMNALNKQMESRYELIEKTKSTGSCQIVSFNSLENIPASIHHAPYILPNRTAAYWNEAYEAYFNVNEVRLVGDSIFKRHFIENLINE